MKDKTAGIIGGLGPETTAEFYLRVNFGYQKLSQTQRPSILIANVPLKLEIERDLLANNTGKERYIPYLTTEAKRLEKAGANFLVMPCNSMHVFVSEIRNNVKIPMISIVEETCDFIKLKEFKKVGLVSTSATVKNKVYETEFEKRGINFTVPNQLEQAEMNKIIQNLVDGIHLNSDRDKIMKVIANLKLQKCDAIALACTDLQLLLPSDDEILIFDTMELLAQATIRELL